MHMSGTLTTINYDWGSYLQYQNNPWRMAATSSIWDWNAKSSRIDYSWGNDETVLIDLYYDSSPGSEGGICVWYFNSSYLIYAEVLQNSYYSWYSTNQMRSATGHELGHGLGLGHILNTDTIALMGNNPDTNLYFMPQLADIYLLNIVYP